ncbi:MAG TPA: aldehyde dehydrogenase family protein, partial [Steroidobacteraceae bacterium]|nr:aldehyde dehydrogenase family protein [Steroidobacteraceae bacterium]
MATPLTENLASMDYGAAPEDAALCRQWLGQYSGRFGHYIDGAWVAPADGRYFNTCDPSTGAALAEIAQGSAADVEAAVAAARTALKGWQALKPHARARFLYALARQVQKHARRLAVLESMDNGKPIRESRDLDIPLAARHFYYHAGWPQLLRQEFPDYRACGVVGQIIPWNFPLLMLAWKIAPALATGNTVVLKPAEYTPLTALAFAQLCMEIGLPKGVVNIVTGDGTTGEALVKHPDVDKIAFTGSTEVGRAIRRATADSHKKLSLELGGKSPFVVFEDADLDSAVEGLVDGIWLNQGQVCCAGSRLLMQESIAERLIEKVRARMSGLLIGPPLDKTTDIGAIVDRVQLERIDRLVKGAVAEGARCWQPGGSLPPGGLYYKPTLLTDAHPTSAAVQQEIFGPVLTAMTFRTPAEAVELANNTVYGLAASVWSESINLALQVAAQIRAGVVWVNSTNAFDAATGFGGYRESGFGREGGREGIREYLEPTWFQGAPQLSGSALQPADLARPAVPEIERTVKLYIGGKQVRADSGYSAECRAADGTLLGEVALGNRKDIRNAVEAAHRAQSWGRTTAHNRAQVLYYLAENLAQRRTDVAARLACVAGRRGAAEELRLSIERLFYYAAWADKYDGAVHQPPVRNIAIAMNEPLGTVGVLCPAKRPLLGFLSLVLPLLAMGNTVVAVPSSEYPLIAGDLYSLFDTSDLPAGTVNLVTGQASELLKVLAEHDDVAAL